MRIFLDANILFSAAKSEGAVRRLLALLLDAGHECWVDGFVLAEARRNLVAKAPAGIEWLDSILVRLRVGEKQVEVTGQGELPLSEKDRPVLAAAIRHRCQALVTGDRRHFGPLFGETLKGVTIHSPRSLAEALLPE
jgi:predicted nucleic acid-binding protein